MGAIPCLLVVISGLGVTTGFSGTSGFEVVTTGTLGISDVIGLSVTPKLKFFNKVNHSFFS